MPSPRQGSHGDCLGRQRPAARTSPSDLKQGQGAPSGGEGYPRPTTRLPSIARADACAQAGSPLPLTSIMPRGVVLSLLFSSQSRACAASLMCAFMASLELSMRDAVLTVSPKRQSGRGWQSTCQKVTTIRSGNSARAGRLPPPSGDAAVFRPNATSKTVTHSAGSLCRRR